MKGIVRALSRYPIKGLSGERLGSVTLEAQGGFPGDRMFGFAKKNSGFDPAHPKVLPKDRFIVLFQHAQLAGLDTTFDPNTRAFQISDKTGATQRFDLTRPEDQDSACRFLSDLLQLPADEMPFFVHAFPHRFTDVSVDSPVFMNAVSLINLDSVAAFGAAISATLDPERFRGNIQISGWPAMSELDLEGAEVRIGDVLMRGLRRTQRCAATEVNPETAERDIALPYALKKTYGHRDMGLYLEMIEGGEIRVGDPALLV